MTTSQTTVEEKCKSILPEPSVAVQTENPLWHGKHHLDDGTEVDPYLIDSGVLGYIDQLKTLFLRKGGVFYIKALCTVKFVTELIISIGAHLLQDFSVLATGSLD